MIIKESEANKKIVSPMMIKEYRINSDFTVSLIEIDGSHGKIRSLEDRIYFILDGGGKFTINGEESTVSKEDLVFIQKNTPYDITGKMKYLLIHSPEFKSENDVSLE